MLGLECFPICYSLYLILTMHFGWLATRFLAFLLSLCLYIKGFIFYLRNKSLIWYFFLMLQIEYWLMSETFN